MGAIACSRTSALQQPASAIAYVRLYLSVEVLIVNLKPSEDLNALVRRHIESVISRGPPKALATLETDAADLINTGMITLNAKLAGIEDEKLIGHVVRIWCFFWDQVLPYVEGVRQSAEGEAHIN